MTRIAREEAPVLLLSCVDAARHGLLLVAFVIGALACGKEGSGASATGPSQTSSEIVGRVVGNPSRAAVQGAMIRYQGGTVTTNSEGRFAFSANGVQRIAISADGHIPRETGVAPGSDALIDLIEDRPPFDLQVYRYFLRGGVELIRDQGQPPAQLRYWERAPNLFVKTIFEDTGAHVPQSSVDTVIEVFRSLLPTITGGKLSAAAVDTGDSTSVVRPGWIIVKWYEGRNPEGPGCGTGGVGSTGSDDAGTATISLRSGCPSGGDLNALSPPGACYRLRPVSQVRHELMHALGFYHIGPVPNAFYGQGIPGVPCAETDAGAALSAMEKLMGAIAFSRPRRNADPDVDPEGFVVNR